MASSELTLQGNLRYTTLPIQLFKDVLSLSEWDMCQSILNDEEGWTFGHTSGVSSRQYRIPFWNKDLNEVPLFSEVLLAKIKTLTGMSFQLQTVYANGQTYGLDGDFHIDHSDSDAYTCLLYVSDLSDEEYDRHNARGYTEFLLPDDTVYCIPPNPNTAILFPSNLYHRGMSYGRFERQIRMSIAWKLRRMDQT